MDVVASYTESRDQRGRREKMRALGRKSGGGGCQDRTGIERAQFY